MRKENPNCDGSGPHSDNPSVRKYPLGGGANAILCRACVTGPDYHGKYTIHVQSGGTGFSPAEMAGAMQAIEVNK